MRSGDKSELTDFPIVDGVVIKGSVINKLKPDHESAFINYAVETVYPYVKRYKPKCCAERADVCYDYYSVITLKRIIREKIGSSISVAPARLRRELRLWREGPPRTC